MFFNQHNNVDHWLKNRYINMSLLALSLIWINSYAYGDSFLCRPWLNVNSGEQIGDSFTSEIKDGVISFLGAKKPISFAQLIYSHPLNDIFLAGSGELVTAGLEGARVRVNVYFPNKDARFFVTTSCSRI